MRNTPRREDEQPLLPEPVAELPEDRREHGRRQQEHGHHPRDPRRRRVELALERGERRARRSSAGARRRSPRQREDAEGDVVVLTLCGQFVTYRNDRRARPSRCHAYDRAVRAVIFSTVLPAIVGLDAAARSVGLEPVAVITPRAARNAEAEARRDAILTSSPEGLDVCFAADKSSLERLTRAYEPEIGLCTGYPWRLPPEVLAIPRLGVVNTHPSRLPQLRGPFRSPGRSARATTRSGSPSTSWTPTSTPARSSPRARVPCQPTRRWRVSGRRSPGLPASSCPAPSSGSSPAIAAIRRRTTARATRGRSARTTRRSTRGVLARRSSARFARGGGCSRARRRTGHGARRPERARPRGAPRRSRRSGNPAARRRRWPALADVGRGALRPPLRTALSSRRGTAERYSSMRPGPTAEGDGIARPGCRGGGGFTSVRCRRETVVEPAR